MAVTQLHSHPLPEPGDAAELLRRHGLKVTPQRVEILRTILSTDCHPDAEYVHDQVRRQLPTIALDTVYRGLNSLVEHGLVERVDTRGDRARFDGKTEPHHHFVCEGCGMVADFDLPAVEELPMPPAVKKLGTIHSRRLQVRGLCSDCAAGRQT